MAFGSCRRVCAVIATVAGACSPTGLPATATPTETADPGPYLEAFRTAVDRLVAGRHDEARAALERAAAIDPRNDVVAYLTAVASLRANDREAALRWLTRLEELDSDLVPGPPLAVLAGDPRFERIVSRTQELAASRSAGVVEAFRIEEPGLLPEGIAFEPASRSFLIGSIHGRKILRVRDGKAEDFVPASRGLHAVLGLRVDPRRGIVWAATEADKDEDSYRSEDDGRSELFAFDAATGATRERYAAPDQGKHLFNDIAIGRDGTAFVTDSEAGGVWAVSPGDARLRSLVPAGALSGPNGIAWDEGSHALLVADSVTVWRVDPDRGARAPLGSVPGVSLAGLDGMYVIGGWLVGVQTIVGPGRICAYALAPGHGRILERRILAAALPSFAEPTTGAFDGHSFYLVANSQNAAPPAPTVILRVPLPP